MTRPPRCYERPVAGDVAVSARGWKREVRRVWVDRIEYVRSGIVCVCELGTWVRWCQRFTAEYRRGDVDLLQLEAEAALASGEDHL